jgi:aminoglycoside phosphotransferase family enzyme/predicted kinase
MKTISQDIVFTALGHPACYPHPVKSIAVRETHISQVFLVDPWVYKVKKAVRLAFLDYSTLALRRHFCRLEIELNRRLARDIYMEVVPIAWDGRRIAVQGPGEVIEYAVRMRYLPDHCSMLRRLHAGNIGNEEMDELASALNDFYQATPPTPESTAWGDETIIRANCEDNFTWLEQVSDSSVDSEKLRIIQVATQALLARGRELFQDRKAGGFIREGHGDLRCGHVYQRNGIQIIDCIEFDPRYRCGDIAADLGFLAMDLDFEGYPGLARRLVQTYAALAGDPQLWLLLPFYKCYRAMVRVKVNALRLREPALPTGERAKLRRHTLRLMSLAYQYALCFAGPTLWVICGLPASGKSTLAETLGKLLRAEVISSDQTRKQFFAKLADGNAEAPFETGLYTPVITARTYASLFVNARLLLEKGLSVILDATFSRREQRQEALVTARDAGATIIFVECTAPVKHLEMRLRDRQDKSCISDARLRHLPDFIARYETFADMAAPIHVTVDTTAPLHRWLIQLMDHHQALRAHHVELQLKA